MIQIDILRISTDGKFLEFSVACKPSYGFNTLLIHQYSITSETDYIDLSSIFEEKKAKYVVRIPLDLLGGSSMYHVHFKIEYTGPGEAPIDECDAILETEAVCSDVSNVYKYILLELINLTKGCCVTSIPVDIQRMFTILYAHIEAMRLQQFDDAAQFYDVLRTNFSTCWVPERNLKAKPCNCANHG